MEYWGIEVLDKKLFERLLIIPTFHHSNTPDSCSPTILPPIGSGKIALW